MTALDAPGSTCPTCERHIGADQRFCTSCGATLIPSPRSTEAWPYADPTPSLAPSYPPSGSLPRPWPELEPRRRTHPGVWVVCAVLLLVAVVLGVIVATTSDPVPPSPVSPPTPTTAYNPPVETAPQSSEQALAGLARDDAGTAESTVGTWLPQLSAKQEGLVADGQVWDSAGILREHEQLRARYSGAFLVWSGDYVSFSGLDFWVTLVNRPFSTADQAIAWCSTNGFDSDHCYAKRLSHTGGSSLNTGHWTGG